MQKLKIEKLVEGGQGIAHENNQIFFVWEVLPGEEIEAETINKRKGIYEARAVNILKPSPHRIAPTENHFLSCSPWQIMDFEYENKIKKEITVETFKRIGGITVGADPCVCPNAGEHGGSPLQIATDSIQFGYRNKMEFSFVTKDDGKISLAFFGRGQKKKNAIDGCELASPVINKTAKKILDWINENQLTERNLKSLIIRSNKKGEAIAGLFIKDKLNLDCRGLIHQAHEANKNKFVGFALYYSTHKSPASVITETLYQEGQDFLVEEIAGTKLKYGINSFFQVNVPVFEQALEDVSESVGTGLAPVQKRQPQGLPLQIIDFYSGVGTIGLSIANSVGNSHGCSVQLVESNEEAVDFAKQNIELNKIRNVKAILAPAEKALDYIKEDSIIVFDPPRAGLHQKIVDRILEAQPKKIIYLSCNVATQARDIGLLKEAYNIKFIKLYNFFPRTPHIESLCVLEVKK